MMNKIFFAFSMLLLLNKGECRAFMIAFCNLFSPFALPIAIRAFPPFFMTVSTSQKSQDMVPTIVMISAIPFVAVVKISSALAKASFAVVIPSV